MADRLAELLAHAADQHTQGAAPPPIPSAWQVRSRAHGPGRRRLWAPLAAAAAVVAVAVPAAVLSQRSGPDPITVAGPAVSIEPVETARLLSTDAGTPNLMSLREAAPPCASQNVGGILDLKTAQLRIELAPKTNACTIGEMLRLELDGVAVQHLTQPDVPNPPSFDGQLLDASGVLLNADWTGSCTATPTNGLLRGIGNSPVAVEVTGRPTDCSEDRPAGLGIGPAHRPGSAGAFVPADRAGLRVEVSLPDEVRDGERVAYTVRLTNPTPKPIDLNPCPTFRYSLRLADGSGGGNRGRLPCDRLPTALPGRSALDLTGDVRLPATEAGTASGEATLVWQIAGPEEASATTRVVRPAPRQLAAVPYLAPEQAPAPTPGIFRYRSGGGAFPVRIEGADTVAAGEVLRYRAVLTNPAGAEDIPLRPCPGWTETFVVAPKAASNATPVVRRAAINCAEAPERIRAGETITFELQLVVPEATAPGPYQLFWQIDGGIDSGPFDLTVTQP
jgi:hypothetical protein